MKLMELLAHSAATVTPPSNPEILSVVSDSRRVEPGALFVAIRGEKDDGARYAAAAATRGAAAIASDRPPPKNFSGTWVEVRDARRAASVLSARILGDPASKLKLVAVTGTNGKTTTATLLASIFEIAWGASGFVGTVGYRWDGKLRAAPRTTPEGDVLNAILAEMVEDGIPACAIEVSSHALSLSRVDGLAFDAAVFTNLTQDHLDFHRDLESYGDAKGRLFSLRKEGGAAIVNRDDEWGRKYLAEVPGRKISYSPSGDGQADFRAVAIETSLSGTRFRVEGREGAWPVSSPLSGRFNVENLLAAWTAAWSLSIDPATISRALGQCAGAPGRMERVDAGQPFVILVDYAHTEDALRRLLSAVRELSGDQKRVIAVFGCGGDRDRGKRQPMARAAAELSDFAVATSDNPRGEDPEAILDEVERGFRALGATNYVRLADRRAAIRKAIAMANENSVVVIAGKGHETEQIIGNESFAFDDRKVAAEIVAEARSRGAA